MAQPKVWITVRKLDGGKRSYSLRWICPVTRKYKMRSIGTDKRIARAEAEELRKSIRERSYRVIQQTTWAAFQDEVVNGIAGGNHKAKTRRAMARFGTLFPVAPADVTYAMVRDFATKLRTQHEGDSGLRKLSPATINGIFRYLRLAFNEGVELGYLKTHPMPRRWKWEPEDERSIREVTRDEQAKLERAARDVYGSRWLAFIVCALGTGARRGELLSLSWGNVDLDAATVQIATSKTHRPRTVPVNPVTVRALRRLRRNFSAAVADGPFSGMEVGIDYQWGRICEAAGLPDVRLHDLRRTYITRLIRAGVALPLVSKLAGNGIGVIMEYYNACGTDDDKKLAVSRIA